MIALLHVNVLVALFDPAHVHHELAHAWFAGAKPRDWASCPLTENGLLRVLSHPAYPGRRVPLADAGDRLARFRGAGGHHFWPDELSLCDDQRFDLTEAAVKNGPDTGGPGGLRPFSSASHPDAPRSRG